MAATPPRSASPAPRPVVVPKPGHNLQISPNLEALLQHDELTRRNSSSPTSACYASPSSGFPISLPPPPPRKSNGGRKVGQREQEPIPTTRGQRQKSTAAASISWPDALPATFPPDGGASVAGRSSGTSSRPVTPNPYLNPTPVLNTSDLDEAPTPKQADKPLPNEPKPDPSRSAAETPRRTAVSDASHRPNALHKVEKILWMGRDSLSLFSTSANGAKRDSDRRNDRGESGDLDAVQDKQIRQVPVASTPTVSRPSSRFGDRDTASVTSSSNPGTSCLHALQQGPSEFALHLTRSGSSLASDPSPAPPFPPSHFLPRLSLPSIFMSSNSPQRPQPVDNANGNDYLSFIDFFSPSTTDDSSLSNKSRQSRSSRPRLSSINIPSPSLYSSSHHNLSSTSLSSMKFAPPSPTSVQSSSPPYLSPDNSSSCVTLARMVFAPPSPSVERVPTRLQPSEDPPSPFSPLQFAPPPSPPSPAIDEPSPRTALGLAPERGRKLKSKKRSKSTSPFHILAPISPLPPTTNELNANERADRIWRNRKLARVFGMMPCADEPVTDVDDPRVSKKLHSPVLAALLAKPRNHRHAVSVSLSLKTAGMKIEPPAPWQTDDLWSPDGRRHSTPLTSDFTLYTDDERDGKAPKDFACSRKITDSPDAASTRSFIDLSDEDVRDDDVSELSCFVPHLNWHRRIHHSNSTPSLVESINSEVQVELEKRRKREKLAKLHRFLGSRVPPEAINGNVFGPPLPPPAPAPPTEECSHEHWLRRNKHASNDNFDRGKGELDEREKAVNVRRAQKMERVFGTPPPQVLFHTRPTRPTVPASLPASPAAFNPYVLTLDLPFSRNPNKSTSTDKTLYRESPSDSSRCLLPRKDDTPQSSPSVLAQSFADSLPGYQQILAQSSVYLNYQHSLNSLIDIIDRDDRRSLVELHHFLHDTLSEDEVVVNPRRPSNAGSLRSERRHSLPSNASMTSLSSEFYASPKTSRFQIRRRTAAKLTNFFGVDYRELIHNILESIEKGVEEERKRGTLQPREVEVLMHRVRGLRSLNDPFPS